MGIGLIIFGLLFALINIVMLVVGNQYMPKLFSVGIVVFFVGMGFIVFPGPDIDLESGKGDQFFKNIWKMSGTREKIGWIAFLLLGIVRAVMVFKTLHLQLA